MSVRIGSRKIKKFDAFFMDWLNASCSGLALANPEFLDVNLEEIPNSLLMKIGVSGFFKVLSMGEN